MVHLHKFSCSSGHSGRPPSEKKERRSAPGDSTARRTRPNSGGAQRAIIQTEAAAALAPVGSEFELTKDHMLPALFALAMGLISLVLLVRDALALRRIPRITPATLPEPPPTVSVIIPARNEERAIAASAGEILRQDYPTLP